MKKKILNEIDWYSRQTINTTFQQIAKELKKITNSTTQLPNITEISNSAFTTPSSVTRFCNQLGYKGYKEFSNRFAFELEYERMGSYLPQVKSYQWTSEYIFNLYFETLIKDFRRINEENFPKIVRATHNILKQKNIFLLSSDPLAMYFYRSLMALGINVSIIQNFKLFEELLEMQKINENSYCLLFVFGIDSEWTEECLTVIQYQNIKNSVFSNKVTLIEQNLLTNTIIIKSSSDSNYDFQDDLLLLNYLLNQILKLVLNKIRTK